MKKMVMVLGLVAGLGFGLKGYMESPKYKAEKAVEVTTRRIETNIRKQSLMVKNQKHGAVYTRQQWEEVQEELKGLRRRLAEEDQLRRNIARAK